MMNDETKKPKIDHFCSKLDRIEPFLFKFKYFALLAVVGSLIISITLFFFGIYEVFHLFYLLLEGDEKIVELSVLGTVDLFLFGMVMLIFAFGSYNLFISKLDHIEADTSDEIVPKWVKVKNFGELKTIFIKVIIMILAIIFLELVIVNFHEFKKDVYAILIIPVGIVLIAYAQKLLNFSHE